MLTLSILSLPLVPVLLVSGTILIANFGLFFTLASEAKL